MTKSEIAATLRAAGIENAQGEAALLAEALSGEALEAAVARRCTHYPLQYILGEWPFYREIYEVNEHCLIPRSDTEILVDEAVHILGNGARFLDLCTGSGCIAVSTLANRPDTTGVAVDLFPQTLEIAKRNAQKNGVSERFTPLCHDVLAGPGEALPDATFNAILSNPPYIQAKVMRTLQHEVTFEPEAALCGGEDGLSFYRTILDKWVTLLKKGGVILFEIGYDQGEDIQKIAVEHGFGCTVKKDFGGNDRVAILKKMEI